MFGGKRWILQIIAVALFILFVAIFGFMMFAVSREPSQAGNKASIRPAAW